MYYYYYYLSSLFIETLDPKAQGSPQRPDQKIPTMGQQRRGRGRQGPIRLRMTERLFETVDSWEELCEVG